MLKLRYIIDTKHRPKFTASRICRDKKQADMWVNLCKKANQQVSYTKYGNFVLYDGDTVVERY